MQYNDDSVPPYIFIYYDTVVYITGYLLQTDKGISMR